MRGAFRTHSKASAQQRVDPDDKNRKLIRQAAFMRPEVARNSPLLTGGDESDISANWPGALQIFYLYKTIYIYIIYKYTFIYRSALK